MALGPKLNVSMLVEDDTSPQSTSRVKVSSVPGSVMVTVRFTMSFSKIEFTESSTSVGATLFTVTIAVFEPTAPSSSATVTVMV